MSTIKQQYIKQINEVLPVALRLSEKDALIQWWHNPRVRGGLRLSEAGYKIFRGIIEVESYRYEIKSETVLTSRILLNLDSKLAHPYYLNRRHTEIVLFGGKDGMMLSLYDGDIEKWISV